VGPRPEQPRIFAELRSQIPRYQDRQRVLPGITGWAQVNQAYDQTTDDVRRKIEFDLEYIEQESPLQDLKILLYTLPAVMVRRGGW
jgi:lipopolysaccharide/colanic/teichoic acid biosynthesis glycosyltransferase